MSKNYSGRIHDPNHKLSEYDIYFNEDLISGAGVYTVQEIADVFGTQTSSGSQILIQDAAPFAPVSFTAPKADTVKINVYNKNLIKIHNKTTRTVNGVTFVFNDDGTVTANGTATSNVELNLLEANTDDFLGLKINTSGCPAGGGSSTYRIQIVTGGSSYGSDSGSGNTAVGRADTNFRIFVASGYTCSDVTFTPLAVLYDVTDQTFIIGDKKSYDINTIPSDSDPIDVMYYANVELFAGVNLIATSSGSANIEYIDD